MKYFIFVIAFVLNFSLCYSQNLSIKTLSGISLNKSSTEIKSFPTALNCIENYKTKNTNGAFCEIELSKQFSAFDLNCLIQFIDLSSSFEAERITNDRNPITGGLTDNSVVNKISIKQACINFGFGISKRTIKINKSNEIYLNLNLLSSIYFSPLIMQYYKMGGINLYTDQISDLDYRQVNLSYQIGADDRIRINENLKFELSFYYNHTFFQEYQKLNWSLKSFILSLGIISTL